MKFAVKPARHRRLLRTLKLLCWQRSQQGAYGWIGNRLDSLEHWSTWIAAVRADVKRRHCQGGKRP